MALLHNKQLIKTAITEIFNRRRGVAAEPSNRHEEKESFFHPAFTLVVDALVKKLSMARPRLGDMVREQG